jgi:hypothetical protein
MKTPRDIGDKQASIRIGWFVLPQPATKRGRKRLGIALTAAGSVVPIIGWPMLSLGVVILSAENPTIRRRRRKLLLWWGRRTRKKREGRE